MSILWLVFMILAMGVAGVLARNNPNTLVLGLPYQWEIHTTALEMILYSLGMGGGFVFLHQALKGRHTRKRLREYETQLATLRERNQQLLQEAEKHRSELTLITSRLAEMEGRYFLEGNEAFPALEDQRKKEAEK